MTLHLNLPTGRVPLATVLQDIANERQRQDEKWGPNQQHTDIRPGWSNFNYGLPTARIAKITTDQRAEDGKDTWTDILVEELCEAIEEAAKGDQVALRTELVQVAAVCAKWIEDLDARYSARLAEYMNRDRS
jgi:hypothetical protein